MVERTVEPPAPVTVVTGPEELIVDRTVSEVIRAARAVDPEADVTETAGAELTVGALGERLSPSLFASRRVLVVRQLQDVDDSVGAALVAAATAAADDAHLVLCHPGVVKGRKLVDALRRAGAQVVVAERLTKPDDQVAFVRSEVHRAGGRIDESAARKLVDAAGGDLRGLASTAAQLTADAPDGVVTSSVVATYVEGRAEVKGWVVADRAVEGKTAAAVEQLRWALETGTDPVLITAALATALRSLARLAGTPRGRRDADVARELGVPPWKVRMLRSQLRGWTPAGLARAIRAVAEADLAVKGASNDATLALTSALVTIGTARTGT